MLNKNRHFVTILKMIALLSIVPIIYSIPSHSRNYRISESYQNNSNDHQAVENLTIAANTAFIGVGDELVLLNISGVSDPVEINRITIDNGKIEDIALKGTTAFIAAGGAGLCVMNVLSGTRPQIVQLLPTPGYAEGVAINNHLAYVADGGAGIRVIDISESSSAREIGFAFVTGYAFDVEVIGSYAYIAGGGGGLLVVDISDPLHPKEIGQCNTPGYTYGLKVAGNFAYLADGWEGFRIVDVSNPENPIEIGHYKTPGWSFDVDIVETRAYVADAFAGVRILDITNPHQPVEIGAYEGEVDIHGVSVKDGFIYAADRKNGLRSISVSNVQQPISTGLYRLGNYAIMGASDNFEEEHRIEQYNLRGESRKNFSVRRKLENNRSFELEAIGQVGGPTQAVAVDGDLAYIGVGLRMEVLDIRDRTNPKQIGATSILRGFITDVEVTIDQALVTLDRGELWIIDISDPTHPLEIASVKTPGFPECIETSGTYAYIACGGAGLRVVDISDPEHPNEAGYLYTRGYAHDVNLIGQTAYVAAAGSGFCIVDISDPENPLELSSYNTPGFTRSVAAKGDFVLLADGDNGLRIMDVSDPVHPSEMSSYLTSGHALNVEINETICYITTASGFTFLDISDPVNIIELGRFEDSGLKAEDVKVSEDILFIADGDRGLRLINVTDPSSPTAIGLYKPMGSANVLDIAGNYAFVGAGQEGLYIFDVSDPDIPRQVGWYDTKGYISAIEIDGDYLYFGTVYSETDGFNIVDISNPSEPKYVHYFMPFGGGCAGLVLSGKKAYYSNEGGILIIDISDPSNPIEMGYIHLKEGPYCTGAVDVSDTLAFVTQAQAGLKIINVTDPHNPVLSGIFQNGDRFNDVVAVRNHAYICCRNLFMLDVSDPENPTQIGLFESPEGLLGINISEEIAYLSFGKNGLIAVDVADPSNPTPVAEYNTPGHCWMSVTDDDFVYCADGKAGFIILKKIIPPRQRSIDRYQKAESLVVTNTGDSGYGSLRWCLENAQNGQIIIFDPQTFPPSNPDTISLNSALPPITQGNITIDASYAGVIISGKNMLNGNGLQIYSYRNTIKGLQILFFPENGIDIFGDENTIGGDRAAGNGPVGEGNVISGNVESSIKVEGNNNSIIGNLIGTDVQGTGKLPNMGGIELNGHDNRIGASGSSSNVISGNNHSGIGIRGNSNIIVNNLIGTDITGTHELGNAFFGIAFGGRNNIIGGDEPWERNIISGNGSDGIRVTTDGNFIIGNYIGTDISGRYAIGNHEIGICFDLGAFNTIVKNNLVSGNFDVGIAVGDCYNIATGNIVGLDASGTMPLPNKQGIVMGSSYNRIGGIYTDERNIISGNNQGIDIGVDNQIVIGNYIGTDITGTFLISNSSYGVECGGEHNFLGGVTDEEKNIIVGNSNGIRFNAGESYFIAGNYIGANIHENFPISNLNIGIYLANGFNNYIGPGNLVTNCQQGIRVSGNFTIENSISRNSITNNDIGIDLIQGGNTELISPYITDFTSFSVYGTAHPYSTIEIFSDPEEEGMIYEGTTISDSSGGFSFTIEKGLAGPNVTATVTDMDGNTSEFSNKVQGVNDRPFVVQAIDDVILSEDFTSQLIVPNLNFCFSDAPPETLLVFSAISQDSLTKPIVQDDSLIIRSVLNAWGKDEIIVTATDIPGLSVRDTFYISIKPLNDPPGFINLPDTLSFSYGESDTLFLWDFVADPETPDSLLVYSFNIGSDSVQLYYDIETGFLTLSAENEYYGRTDLFISVTDDSQAVTSESIIVEVHQPTGIEMLNGQKPITFKLYQNYPNPFNHETNIRYDVPMYGHVRLEIYNILGQRIRTLVNGLKEEGTHKVIWNSRNDSDNDISSGVYFIKFESAKTVHIKKILLLQ